MKHIREHYINLFEDATYILWLLRCEGYVSHDASKHHLLQLPQGRQLLSACFDAYRTVLWGLRCVVTAQVPFLVCARWKHS